MAKKKSKPEKKVSAKELGPTRFTSQKDYEEQVAFEIEPDEKLGAEPEEKTE